MNEENCIVNEKTAAMSSKKRQSFTLEIIKRIKKGFDKNLSIKINIKRCGY